MAFQSSKGIAISEPGGALRMDVAAENSGSVQTRSDGLYVKGHYGAEASMYALNDPTGFVASGAAGAGVVVPVPFAVVTQDYSEFSGLPQCDAASGVLTAQANGLYEVGMQVLLYADGIASFSWTHMQLAIYTDFGFGSMSLNPSTPFGTAGVSLNGTGWWRIGQKTIGAGAGDAVQGSTFGDAFGTTHAVSMQWYVSDAIGGNTAPAPMRFRFSARTNNTGLRIIGANPRQTYCWMRWLRP